MPTIDGQAAFVPNPLPGAFDAGQTVTALASASHALGELNGIGRTLENPYLLVTPLQAKEALTSSSMEGTYTTLDDLMLFEAGLDDEGRLAPDTREVRNYSVALRQAIDSLDDLPLCLRTIRNAHATLLAGLQRERGGSIDPGEFRDTQNWIGARAIARARFVPPPPREAKEALYQLESYIQRENRDNLPPLIDAALVHYQFEAIHPFADGNGRVGRILIPIFLMERGVLSRPLLYLSPFFEAHKDEYIDHMYAVSRSGNWVSWIEFFLHGVEQSARRATSTADRLLALRLEYRVRLQKAGRSALLLALVDYVFLRPIFTIPAIAAHLEVTYRAAQKNVEMAASVGVIEEVQNTSHPKYFAARELLNAVNES